MPKRKRKKEMCPRCWGSGVANRTSCSYDQVSVDLPSLRLTSNGTYSFGYGQQVYMVPKSIDQCPVCGGTGKAISRRHAAETRKSRKKLEQLAEAYVGTRLSNKGENNE